jgi:hypothetical protein
MDTFMLPVLLKSYAFTPGNNVREQKLEGGMPRQVIKFVGAIHSVTASVALVDEGSQQYFWAFWRQNQGKNWNWELVLDNGNLEQCECRFTSDSLPTESNRGADFLIMSFQVLVKPIKRNPDFDRTIVDLWQSGLINNLGDLEKIPNVWMPDALGV